MTQLHELTALEQAAAVRSGQTSPTELVDHHLARIQALDAGIGAFVTVTPERARAAATAAERRLAEGGELPPLLGVPTAIKDLNLTAEQQTQVETLMKDQMAQRGSRPSGPPTDEERQAMQTRRAEMDTKLKAILTPEQYAKYQAMRSQRGPRDGSQAPAN